MFYILFQAILAAVVIANLIGLLRQFSRLRDLWKIHKPDAVRYRLATLNTTHSQQIEANRRVLRALPFQERADSLSM